MSTQQSPNMTIVSHSDNEHSQAEEILAAIEIGLKGFELIEPFILQIVTAENAHTVTIPATTNKEN